MSWDEAFAEITELYQSELYEEALVLCAGLLEQTLSDVERGHVLRRIGECHFRLGRPLSALSLFEEAEASLSGDSIALGLLELDRAIVRREMGDLSGSEEHFATARHLLDDNDLQEVIQEEYEELLRHQKRALRFPGRYQLSSALAGRWISQLKA